MTTVTITVTPHAVSRYRERIESCTKAEAIDRLTHAVEIARPASPVLVSRFAKGRQWYEREASYLHCPVENLFLVCLTDEAGGLAVLTVYRAEARAVV
jgi:hypothetical protein